MDLIKDGVLSLCVASLISAIVVTLSEKTSLKDLMKFICGVFLSFTLLRTFMKLKSFDFIGSMEQIRKESESAVQQGEELAYDSMVRHIKDQTAAYILNKAQTLGLNLEVEVILSEDDIPVPIGVILRGIAPPYSREKLTAYIRNEIGIPREDQIWISGN